jgi:hypothetical protein
MKIILEPGARKKPQSKNSEIGVHRNSGNVFTVIRCLNYGEARTLQQL